MQHGAGTWTCIHKDISREVELVNLEIRGRQAARRSLARPGRSHWRAGDWSKLVAVMIQTDRFGTSIADSCELTPTSCAYDGARKPKSAPRRWA